MASTAEYIGEDVKIQKRATLSGLGRTILLSVLGYEAAGCLAGGSLLIADPDGRLMDMPVEMMRGAFSDFLIPGIILFGLGVLNTLAYISVLRKRNADWFTVGLALGGLFTWFAVEIIILQALHWLHLMWGMPVMIGWVAAIRLISLRHYTERTRKVLLVGGILASLWYVAINVYVPICFEGYNLASMTVSELSALGAPTRIIWVLLATPYTLLSLAFGWGVLQSATGNRQLRVVGILIIVYSIFNFYWPPMHQRGLEPTLTDILHITWTIITVVLMITMMAFGAAALDVRFRIYTIVSMALLVVFGILTSVEAPNIHANGPTPLIGIWERINIGIFMLWAIVLAFILLRKAEINSTRTG